MMNLRVSLALAAILLAGNVSMSGAQAPAPKPAAPAAAQGAKPPAPRPAQRPAARPAAGRDAIRLLVTDMVGKTIPDALVVMSGPVSREGRTSPDGALRFETLRPGTYRLRLEAPGYITFEREVFVKAGPPAEVDVALDTAPAKPVEPPPPPPAVPDCRPSVAADPNASIDLVALPDWIEENLIGRNEREKETVVGHAPVMTAAVVQVREQSAERGRADTDEMLYVVAGQGALRAKGRDRSLDAGALVVVPRGVTYTLERRGRNPLILLSITSK